MKFRQLLLNPRILHFLLSIFPAFFIKSINFILTGQFSRESS